MLFRSTRTAHLRAFKPTRTEKRTIIRIPTVETCRGCEWLGAMDRCCHPRHGCPRGAHRLRPWEHLVACPVTRHGVIIDPGDEVDQLLQWIAAEQVVVEHILLTHAHVDHVTGVGIARAALRVPVWLHRDDAHIYDHALEQARRFGLTLDTPLPPVDRWYADGDQLTVGTLRIRPLHTPGHCPGGVCLAVTQIGRAHV